ncbi:unnamed protein product [Paramecium sonneborni]|uniref:Uncharacterized protein n=1 Tax=Paramecium sonneborni TaxID=65129 RepID=A0A8S1RTK8_9CILI|nr:unnamed protein product [Paramecium sonneborni]
MYKNGNTKRVKIQTQNFFAFATDKVTNYEEKCFQKHQLLMRLQIRTKQTINRRYSIIEI